MSTGPDNDDSRRRRGGRRSNFLSVQIFRRNHNDVPQTYTATCDMFYWPRGGPAGAVPGSQKQACNATRDSARGHKSVGVRLVTPGRTVDDDKVNRPGKCEL